MIRFKNSRSRCYVSLPEGEVVKIAVIGLGFYMRRKLLNVHIPDLVHFDERVRQVEILEKEKEKYKSEMRLKSKTFSRKEKVAYMAMESSEEESELETEVDLMLFDAEVVAIFEKERLKKELAHREEQARQKHPIRRVEGQSSSGPQKSTTAPISRSQALDVTHNGGMGVLFEGVILFSRPSQWYPRGRGRRGQQPPKVSSVDKGNGATPSVHS
ncbi:hypothetical protein Ahy_A05g025476 [Arachis hypogaea]|uniref:Uncharacterized protein n=1 Tax=Arachis hypogaea TaxID=3818 RepID=A0A445D8S2_ARAHY|nr:hypothetical protein Ahy_A05g025476 [Arachis hypogaea]